MNADAILDRTVREGDCQIWQGAVQSKGYGSVNIGGGKTALTHRVIFMEMVGPIPEGMTIDHLCRNKLCQNVFHMELVTRGENVRRALAAMTHCKRNHPLSGDNLRLYKRSNGRTHRVCRACRREEQARYRAVRAEVQS